MQGGVGVWWGKGVEVYTEKMILHCYSKQIISMKLTSCKECVFKNITKVYEMLLGFIILCYSSKTRPNKKAIFFTLLRENAKF